MEEGAEGGVRGTTATWIDRHRLMYERATRHPFILSIRDGTVDIAAFKCWLAQDYIFVREFVPFVASVLLKSCTQSEDPSDSEIILGGVASLNDEISWFKTEASKWDVNLYSSAPHRENFDYCRFLQNLTAPNISYTIAISAFWAIETVYQESFSLCLEDGAKTPPELIDACQRWGSADFAQYCHSIRNIADRCLEKAQADEIMRAEEIFQAVLLHEIHFWNMSFGES